MRFQHSSSGFAKKEWLVGDLDTYLVCGICNLHIYIYTYTYIYTSSYIYVCTYMYLCGLLGP